MCVICVGHSGRDSKRRHEVPPVRTREQAGERRKHGTAAGNKASLSLTATSEREKQSCGRKNGRDNEARGREGVEGIIIIKISRARAFLVIKSALGEQGRR